MSLVSGYMMLPRVQILASKIAWEGRKTIQNGDVIFVVMPSLYRSKMESMYLHQLLSKTNHRVSLGFPSCCGIFCNSNSRSCSPWKSCNLHAHYIYRVNSIICHEVGSLAKRWGRVISRWNSTSSMEHSNRGSCEHHLEAPSRHTFQAKKLW